ncbi:MAG: cysteine desulfurase [Cytophagales bacterium]|nr:MAG: cysteine desulfurase [Cytophagales bacterium]
MIAYLDNAASTPIDKTVLEAMYPYLTSNFGNPSSIHAHGRAARSAIEIARKSIASLLNTSPSEIFFTSGGTEADNTALTSTIYSKNIKHVITSPIEHHAVLHCLESLEKRKLIQLSLLEINHKGESELEQLEKLLIKNPNSLVSIMHANNEIGNINDVEQIGLLCKEHNALFHSDTVQTIGHQKIDLQKNHFDFIVGSAHKFHGPKGIGLLYINNRNNIQPFIHGGAQERNMRGGTENISGIIGLAKALEIAYSNIDIHKLHISSLKLRMIEKLKAEIQGITFNGNSEFTSKSLDTILSISLPYTEENDMLLFNLDINNISASGGSACSSGTDIGSHVLHQLNLDENRGNVRFSFSRYNTIEEIDYTVNTLKKIISKK